MEKENKKKKYATTTTNNGIQYFTAGLFLGCVITGLYLKRENKENKENEDKWGVTIVRRNKT